MSEPNTEPSLPGVPPAPPAAPARSIGAIVRLSLGADTGRLVAADPIARLGEDAEGVRQARIASRRLRSHLSTYAPVLRDAPTARLSKDLKWLGRSLGSVRDLDVLRERVVRAVRAIDPLARDDGLELLSEIDAERAAATAALAGVLASRRYQTLLARLGAAVADPPFLRSAGLPAESFLFDALRERFETLAAAVDALPPAPIDTELHEIRILGKPTRYAAEVGTKVLGARCGRFAKRVTDLCDQLGELNDGSKTSEWLDRLAAEPSRASTVARVRAVEIGRMSTARAEWVHSWTRVRAAASEMGWTTDRVAETP